MSRFRAARNAGQALPPAEQEELENLIEAELKGTKSRAQFLLDRRDEMTELAEFLKKDYPDAFVELNTFGARRTNLFFTIGASKQAVMMEYEAMDGYGISRVKSPAEGWFRGSDFAFPDFDSARQCFLSLIETYGQCEME